jgi:predicted nucleotidyltransferase component of viral defense system
MPEPKRNMGASVRTRLLNLAKERNQPHELLLTRYALERLLYRLSTTKHRERFVLKGAMLMTTWFEDPFRPTRDLDLLGFGDPDPHAMLTVFREICTVEADDGVVFDVAGLAVDLIREELEYDGLRIKTNATIGGARVRVVIDIGFGDAIEPGIAELEFPVLLDVPAPRVRAYPRETVIAEKFQAMVALGRANSRMKDLYDVWLLSRAYEFKGDGLPRAIAATFTRRKTPVPVDRPYGLTRAFADDPAKQQQWISFAESIGAELPPLADVIEDLTAFLMPRADAARSFEEAVE